MSTSQSTPNAAYTPVLPWILVMALMPVEHITEQSGNIVSCLPSVSVETFGGEQMEIRGFLWFERYEQTAKYRITARGRQAFNRDDGKTVVNKHVSFFQMNFTGKRKWSVHASSKVKGTHSKARKIVVEFDPDGAIGNDIKSIAFMVPISNTSDQAAVFEYALKWASSVVDSNICYLELYAAMNAERINQAVAEKFGRSE